jgi:hypothetical protein
MKPRVLITVVSQVCAVLFNVACCKGQLTRGGPPSCRLGEGLITPHHKEAACYEMLHRVSELAGPHEYSNEPSGLNDLASQGGFYFMELVK